MTPFLHLPCDALPHTSNAAPADDDRAVTRWVDDDRALADLVRVLLDEPAYGLDTEFLAERTYWPQLCLVQISWAHGVALVDPLAVRRARARRRAARAGDDGHARGRERPPDPRARRRCPTRRPVRRATRRGIRRARVAVALVARLDPARRAARQVGAAHRLVDASAHAGGAQSYAAADVVYLLRRSRSRCAIGSKTWAASRGPRPSANDCARQT